MPGQAIDDAPPRFFQRAFKGGGFAKKARATLSERLGVTVEKPSEDTLLQLGLSENDGIVLEMVSAGSVADTAGLKVGDVLLTLDGQNVPSDPEQFHFQLDNLKTNEPIDAVLLRDGKTSAEAMRLASAQLRNSPTPSAPAVWAGWLVLTAR